MPKLASPHNAADDYKMQDLGDIAHGMSISQGSFNSDKSTPSFSKNRVDNSLLSNQQNSNSVVSKKRSKSQVTNVFDRLSKNEMTTNYN